MLDNLSLDLLYVDFFKNVNYKHQNLFSTLPTPGRRQSKTLLTIDKRGSKIARISVFHCHLSPVRRQMGLENSVSNDF